MGDVDRGKIDEIVFEFGSLVITRESLTGLGGAIFSFGLGYFFREYLNNENTSSRNIFFANCLYYVLPPILLFFCFQTVWRNSYSKSKIITNVDGNKK